MQRGWSAEGLLQPLWSSYGNGDEKARRDQLARAVGTSGSVLSSINTGKRQLGVNLGTRLAAELGVTLHDLGQHTENEATPPGEAGVREELRALRETQDALLAEIQALRRELQDGSAAGSA